MVASTILTNRSKYITIIHDRQIDSADKKKGRDVDKEQPYKRGRRPMFKTTLTLEQNPWIHNYVTSTKEAYSGVKNMKRDLPPTPCQSQHHKHFAIAPKDHNSVNYAKNPIMAYNTNDPVIHIDRDTWKRQMEGFSMAHCLRHKDSKLSCRGRSPLTKEKNYEVLTGHLSNERSIVHYTDFRLMSGDRVLQNIRNNTKEALFG